jgi:hypothetical protein
MQLNPIAGLVRLIHDTGAVQGHDFIQHQRAKISESNPHGIARSNALILSRIQCPHLHAALLNGRVQIPISPVDSISRCSIPVQTIVP